MIYKHNDRPAKAGADTPSLLKIAILKTAYKEWHASNAHALAAGGLGDVV